MIYIDHTEAKANTRLHQTVLDQATILPGLEMVTGADILVTFSEAPEDITTLDRSMCNLPDASPIEIAQARSLPLPTVLQAMKFKLACDNGALIQRKTGRDILSTITGSNGARILEKMQRWCNECWLVATNCYIGRKKDGTLTINRQQTNYTWPQLQGTLTNWQRRGGYTVFLPGDKDLLGWCNGLLEKIESGDKVIELRRQQNIIRLNKQEWRLMLLQIPGWGLVKATALADVSHTFAAALKNLSSPEWLEPDCARRPKKIHVGDVQKARDFFGLTDDHLQVTTQYVLSEKETEQ